MKKPRYKEGDRVYFRPRGRLIQDWMGTVTQVVDEREPSTLPRHLREPWYLVQFDNPFKSNGELPEAESTLYPACEDEHCFAGISGELEDDHRHDRCTKCGFRGDAVYTVTCRRCRDFTCTVASEENLQSMKRAQSRKRKRD